MYKFVVMVNPQEGHLISDKIIIFSDNEHHKNACIESLQTQYPLSTICVYELKAMRKLVGNPKYANYTVQPNGEILPT